MASHELFPYLCVHDGGAAIDFYCEVIEVFEVKETFRISPNPAAASATPNWTSATARS